MGQPRMPSHRITIAGGLLAALILLLFAVPFHPSAPSAQEYSGNRTLKSWLKQGAHSITSLGGHRPGKERLAYVTFLSLAEPPKEDEDGDDKKKAEDYIDEHDDRYFIACRILGYQLMHAPDTKTSRNIPFIVLTTDDISDWKRRRLERDGAIVVPVPDVPPLTWHYVDHPAWREVFTKLRAWELTDLYDRALFVDVDIMLARPLDAIFDEPASQITPTINGTIASMHRDEAPLPPNYCFGSLPEAVPDHEFPPEADKNHYKDVHYFNAGFFVFAPHPDMYKYYLSVMNIKDRFDAQYPEQGLLNYAHRREGSVPWKSIDVRWNIHFPKKKDKDGGVASVHDKWWEPEIDKDGLRDWYHSLRWRMQGFYEAWDQQHQHPTLG